MKRSGLTCILLSTILSVIGFCGCGTRRSFNNSLNNNVQNVETAEETDGQAPVGTTVSDGAGAELPSKIELREETVPVKRYAVSNADGLSVRAAPNTRSSVLGSLDKGDAVCFLGESDGFIVTEYKEKTAYIFKDYCKIMEIPVVSAKTETVIDLGCSLMGYPYVWGSQRYLWGNGVLNGAFKSGEFDCSAFVQYVYYVAIGVVLDVTTRTQVKNGIAVERDDIRRGDLLFFTNSSRVNKMGTERIGHVGIYFGNNYIMHTASDHAVIEPISDQRWSYYITARRVVKE